MGKRTEKGASQKRGAARAAPTRKAASTQGEGRIGLGIRALTVALLLPLVLIPVWSLVRPWVMSSPWAKRLMSKASAPSKEPVQREMRFPTVPFQLPRLRHLPEVPTNKADEAKLAAVKEAFAESWAAYEQHAWGFDEYHPLSKHGINLLGAEGGAGTIGYTIVDALDMLILVGDEAGYRRARDYVRDKLDWNVHGRLNVFETTIRVLGGLLSASALMHDPPAGTLRASEADSRMFLEKAAALAERLLPAFNTPSGVPLREVDLATGEAFPDMDNRNASSLAEATTVQLEFKYLAHRTGDRRFWTVAERPMVHARVAEKAPNTGLLPIFMDSRSGQFFLTDVRLGSRGDSYYEYLVKQYIQTKCVPCAHGLAHLQPHRGGVPQHVHACVRRDQVHPAGHRHAHQPAAGVHQRAGPSASRGPAGRHRLAEAVEAGPPRVLPGRYHDARRRREWEPRLAHPAAARRDAA